MTRKRGEIEAEKEASKRGSGGLSELGEKLAVGRRRRRRQAEAVSGSRGDKWQRPCGPKTADLSNRLNPAALRQPLHLMSRSALSTHDALLMITSMHQVQPARAENKVQLPPHPPLWSSLSIT